MLKRFRVVLSLLLIFGFSATLVGKEGTDAYFPHAIGSYWIYEDPDGNTFTRRAVKEEEIEGKTYRAFTYEPTVEDWADYEYYVQPYFYQGDEASATFFVGDEVEKATKAVLTKEVEIFLVLIRAEVNRRVPGDAEVPFDLVSDIDVAAQDSFYLLPTPLTSDEEWNAMEINVLLTLGAQGDLEQLGGASQFPPLTFDATIVETGKVITTETVKTTAGTFEDCLKVEYRTATTVKKAEGIPESAGESVTTLWLAPNIGIVKFHQESEDILLKMLPESSVTVKSLELARYEIKSTDSAGE